MKGSTEETSVVEAESGSIASLKPAVYAAYSLLLIICAFLVIRLFSHSGISKTFELGSAIVNDPLFWSAVGVGFLAQAVDGALGMAYGVTATSFLLSAGASPAMASASVHVAEIFTTGVSGVAHAKLGNVDRQLFLKLLIPGVAGAVLGALLITSIDGKAMRPYVSAYLVVMGVYIISKAWRMTRTRRSTTKHVRKLALFGGFVDSAGGGGWGPVVATTLIGTGHDPRKTIGSVNFAEFFLTIASAVTFMLMLGGGVWMLVLGLVLGGIFAAPFAAWMTRRINVQVLLILVGTLILVTSGATLYKALF